MPPLHVSCFIKVDDNKTESLKTIDLLKVKRR